MFDANWCSHAVMFFFFWATASGMYIGNNQKPKDGEEKLHLVIEGTSELDVQAGKKEIQR